MASPPFKFHFITFWSDKVLKTDNPEMLQSKEKQLWQPVEKIKKRRRHWAHILFSWKANLCLKLSKSSNVKDWEGLVSHLSQIPFSGQAINATMVRKRQATNHRPQCVGF